MQDGVVDCGITGLDLISERECDVEVLLRLGYGACSLQAAVSMEDPAVNIEDLEGRRIATSHPKIAERALADPRPESVRDALIHVERLSAGAGRAAGQLLALARAQTSNENDASGCVVDLARLTRDCIGEHVPSALATRVDLGYEGPTQGVEVNGDAVMLREALVNLVDNALSYAGEHGTVTVSIINEARTVTLAVEDSGPGVDQEWWPRLGERFFRPPGSRRGGSGLGLAIVRRIADRHGAAVVFDRGRDGLGLRVTLRFSASPR